MRKDDSEALNGRSSSIIWVEVSSYFSVIDKLDALNKRDAAITLSIIPVNIDSMPSAMPQERLLTDDAAAAQGLAAGCHAEAPI